MTQQNLVKMSMNNFDKGEFEKLKNKVDAEYKNIGKIYSPALKSDVAFNSNGFHHLRYDNTRAERSKPAQLNKFRFFNDAVNNLKISTTIQEYRRITCSVGGKDSIVEWFAFWSIISFVKQIRIRVIIRRVGGEDGQYHFWSVMPFWSLQHKQRVIGSIELEDE